MSLELQDRRSSLWWGFSPSHAQNKREFGVSFQVVEMYQIWFIPYKRDLQFRSCFSVEKGNKTELTFVRREKHSDNVVFQGPWRLLLHQLYLCSPPSVLVKVLPFASQGKKQHRKVVEEKLIQQARVKLWCLRFIQTSRSYIPWSPTSKFGEEITELMKGQICAFHVYFWRGKSYFLWARAQCGVSLETPEISTCLLATTSQVWTEELQVNLSPLFKRRWASNQTYKIVCKWPEKSNYPVKTKLWMIKANDWTVVTVLSLF